MSEQPGKKGNCPFVEDPYPNCYLIKMDSLSVAKVMQYCAGDYEQCEIYQERTGLPRSGGT